MTQEAQKALEILQVEHKYRRELDEIIKELPLDKDNPNSSYNQMVQESREPYRKDLIKQQAILHDYCRDHPEIKRELEGEISKLYPKIKAENDKFDKAAQGEYDRLNQRIVQAEKDKAKRKKVKTIAKCILWGILGAWVITYFVLIFAPSPDGVLPNMMIQLFLPLLALPIIGVILLNIVLNTKLNDWYMSAVDEIKSANNRYKELENEKNAKVAHLTQKRDDYMHIVDVINDIQNRKR